MIKKLLILFIAISLAAAGKVAAQTGTALMTTNLSSVLFMTVSSAPTFNFATASDYANGITLTGPSAGTIIVSSSLAYDISVKAASAMVSNSASGAGIPVSDFTVDVLPGSGGTSINAVNLSTTDQLVVDEGTPSILKTLDLEYKANGGTNFLGKPAGSYNTTLTYTLSVD